MGLAKSTDLIYHGLLTNPELILWIVVTDSGSETETSSGLMRTIDPYFSCRE